MFNIEDFLRKVLSYCGSTTHAHAFQNVLNIKSNRTNLSNQDREGTLERTTKEKKLHIFTCCKNANAADMQNYFGSIFGKANFSIFSKLKVMVHFEKNLML
jgi:hypothetical protein